MTSNSADLVKEPTVSVSGDQNGAYRRKYPRNFAVDADNKTIANRWIPVVHFVLDDMPFNIKNAH